MELRHRIDTEKGRFWYGCKRVEFADEEAVWVLDPAKRYELVGAYIQEPHRELIGAKDDASLRNFVRRWGPLTYRLPHEQGVDLLSNYRHARDNLRAWADFLAAIGKPSKLHRATVELLRLDTDPFLLNVFARHQLFFGPRDPALPVDNVLLERISSLSVSDLRTLGEKLLQGFPLSWNLSQNKLILDKIRSGFVVRATIGFHSLEEALYWMIWQDILRKKPFTFCEECGRLIEQKNRHARKFCDDPDSNCAKKRTDRIWRRKKRRAEKGKISFKNGMGGSKRREQK